MRAMRDMCGGCGMVGCGGVRLLLSQVEKVVAGQAVILCYPIALGAVRNARYLSFGQRCEPKVCTPDVCMHADVPFRQKPAPRGMRVCTRCKHQQHAACKRATTPLRHIRPVRFASLTRPYPRTGQHRPL